MVETRAAVVGVGGTDYYKRGESAPQTTTELAGKAILAACADAGLSVATSTDSPTTRVPAPATPT